MGKPLLYLILIFASLICGYLVKRAREVPEEMPASLMHFFIIFILPPIIFLSFWGTDLTYLKTMLVLPLIGGILSLFCMGIALFYSRPLHLSPRQKGIFVLGSGFSNHGFAMGTLLCFILFGEEGFRLGNIYTIFFIPLFYGIGLFIARYYGQEKKEKFKIRQNLMQVFVDPVSLFPLLGIGGGIGMSILGISRPEWVHSWLEIFIPATSCFLLFAIGLTLKFKVMGKFWRFYPHISLIKFVFCPLAGINLAFVFGLSQAYSFLPFKVVILQSVMPMSMNALIASMIYNLDQDLGNSCWIFTTFAVLLMFPLLAKILSF